jgi:hypothetical protein
VDRRPLSRLLSCAVCGAFVLLATAGCSGMPAEPVLKTDAVQREVESQPFGGAGKSSEPTGSKVDASAKKPPALGKGKSIADMFYRAVKPRVGENLDDNGGHELFVRAIDASHSHPKWKMSSLDMNHNYETGIRSFSYKFKDKSRIIFYTEPTLNRQGQVLARTEIRR